MTSNSPKSTPQWDLHDTNLALKLTWLYTKEGYTQRGLSTLFGITRDRVRRILVERMGAEAFHRCYEDKRQQKRSIREAEAEKKRATLHLVKRRTKNIEWALHVCSVYESMRAQTPPATPKAIANELGISQPMLWHFVYEKRHNILEFVRYVSSFNEAELQEILEMREGGATLPQIGKRFHLRTQQVSLALKKARALKTN